MDNGWVYERERLAALEHNVDPGTINALDANGGSSGWDCLEVGAGDGTIAEWLCKKSKP